MLLAYILAVSFLPVWYRFACRGIILLHVLHAHSAI